MFQKEFVVVLGSKQEGKVKATKEAFKVLINEGKPFWQRRKIRVIGMAVESGVPPQPVGIDMGYQGATNRLENAKRQAEVTNLSYDFLVGIENTIAPVGKIDPDRPHEILELPKHQNYPIDVFDMEISDFACIVVEDNKGRRNKATSTSVMFPPEYVKKALESGLTVPAGNFIAEALGGDAGNPQTTMTLGKRSREHFMKDAIISAAGYILLQNLLYK